DEADEVREQLDDARATLSLGLELLSGGDPARAARILVEKPIRSVFQAAMGEAYRLQARARKTAAQGRLPQAQSTTVLDEPLESVVQALLRARPAFHEPGQRRPRAFGSRAEIARAEALLDEAEATLALLSTLGLSAAQLGPKAEEAGLGPAVVKASLAVRALIASQARGEPFSLSGATDEPREKPAGFDEKLDQQLSSSVRDDVGRRAADRPRSVIAASRGDRQRLLLDRFRRRCRPALFVDDDQLSRFRFFVAWEHLVPDVPMTGEHLRPHLRCVAGALDPLRCGERRHRTDPGPYDSHDPPPPTRCAPRLQPANGHACRKVRWRTVRRPVWLQARPNAFCTADSNSSGRQGFSSAAV